MAVDHIQNCHWTAGGGEGCFRLFPFSDHLGRRNEVWDEDHQQAGWLQDPAVFADGIGEIRRPEIFERVIGANGIDAAIGKLIYLERIEADPDLFPPAEELYSLIDAAAGVKNPHPER